MPNTVIFSTEKDVDGILRIFGGIAVYSADEMPKAVRFLSENPNAPLICVGDWALSGWRIPGTQIMFTASYPQDKDIRQQAMMRVCSLEKETSLASSVAPITLYHTLGDPI